jgi:hypothetical protein
MTELAHFVWVPAVGTVAYFGHRVAVTWLNIRERQVVRMDEREERESGAVTTLKARIADAEEAVRQLRVEMKTFTANNRAR